MSGVTRTDKPTYDLVSIQNQMRANRYRISDSAMSGAIALEFDESDIKECVLQLDAGSFYKTMPAERMPGRMQDVYRPTYLGVELYVKLQEHPANQRTIVISFKEK